MQALKYPDTMTQSCAGQMVYYHYPVKNKNTSKHQYFPWAGPYTIQQKIGDCLYKIQENKNSKPINTPQ